MNAQSMEDQSMDAERQRLEAQRIGTENWRLWGPYLSERAWGTVREDYSAGGTAWEDFSHDQARSRAYRWSEDGLGGISDEQQRLCFAMALWNGRDPILKERAFGLSGNEGNRGEDVKEYYFHLDATPSHSWLRYLYKYPQAEYPYGRLVSESRARGRTDPPFGLMDSGVFDGGRYWDVEVPMQRPAPKKSTSGSGPPTGGRMRRRSTCCPISGSATHGPGATTTDARSFAPTRHPPGRPGPSAPTIGRSARGISTDASQRNCCYRKRQQCRTSVEAA